MATPPSSSSPKRQQSPIQPQPLSPQQQQQQQQQHQQQGRAASPSSPSSSSSGSISPSSSPTSKAATASANRRVKLYVLRSENWADLGTGNCTSHFVDHATANGFGSLPGGGGNADPDDEGAWIVVQKEPTEDGKEGAVILRTKIQPYPPGYNSDEEDDDLPSSAAGAGAGGAGGGGGPTTAQADKVEDPGGYQRQQDTLIVWTDKASEADMALSFATTAGCAEIWDFIKKARRWTADQVLVSPSPSPSLSSPQSFPLYSMASKLPEPTLSNLEQVETALRILGRTAVGRERTASAVFKSDYIRKLIKIHQEAEDLESLEDLHRLCRVMQVILLLNDSAIFDLIVRDDIILGVASILEYDPDFPNMKASYRAHLADPSHFTQVVPIRSSVLLAKIHQTHRLYYLKDVVLARILEDSTFSILNSAIYFNEVDIVNEVATDPVLLKELFMLFDEEDQPSLNGTSEGGISKVDDKGKQKPTPPPPTTTKPKPSIGPQLPPELAKAFSISTPTTPPASSSTSFPSPSSPAPPPTTSSSSTTQPRQTDRKHDAILFLQQFSSMAKNLQVQLRSQLFRQLADRGLLRVIEVALSRTVTREDPTMRSATIEILMTLVDHDPSNVRGYSLKQQGAGKRPLAVFLIELFQREEDLGLKAQMAEALRVLVDAGGEGGPLEAPPRIRQEDPEAEKFLQYFYDHCIVSLLSPIMELPIPSASEPILDLRIVDVALCGHLCDLLCFFVAHHTFRSKYFVLSTTVATCVARLFRAKHKHVRLAALRFFRACVGRNDDFYNRFLIKNDLFGPVLEVAMEERDKDNLLGSACLEFFEFIRGANQKAVINHLMERYGQKVDHLARTVKTFALLMARWEANNEPPPKPDTPALGSGPTSNSMTREGSNIARMDFEEESYFNGSDEEDDSTSKDPSSTASRKREGDIAEGDRKRARVEPGMSRSKTWPVAGKSTGRGLVDYGDDEDDDEAVDETPGGFVRSSATSDASSSTPSASTSASASTSPSTTATTNGVGSHEVPPITKESILADAPQFEFQALKRKADFDDDDDLGLLGGGRGKKSTPTPPTSKPNVTLGSASKTPAAKSLVGGGGAIKISFGVKSGSLGKAKEDADKG